MNTFLDPVAANEAKQQAMQQVYDAAPKEWKEAAYYAVWIVAFSLPFFTSDDIWKILFKPVESRGLGPIIRKVANAGYLEFVGTKPTEQESRHAGHAGHWQSKLFGTPPPPGWEEALTAWKLYLT